MSEARRLTKRQVEALTEGYDADPVTALRDALASLADRSDAGWLELVEGIADHPMVDRGALRRAETAATDRLLMLLVESRTLSWRVPQP